jgi:lipoprotein-releasing system ATP-binding protein
MSNENLDSDVVFALQGVKRTFRQGRAKLEVLRSIDLSVRAGEMVALVGPSGSGKSTLLHIAGLLEQPDEGRVFVCGEECETMNDDERTRIRRDYLGFVYQHHHLLPEFSALENIIVPQMISGLKKSDARDRAAKLLKLMGLSGRAKHRPARLSGGEQQRVAVARALANAPRVLLADEPTGNLDPETSGEVFALLVKIAKSAGLACVIATHNPELAKSMDRIVRLEHGTLVDA